MVPDMALKRSKPQRRAPDSLDRLWRFFEARRAGWIAANAGFERLDVIVIDGSRWAIFRKVHVIRDQAVRMDKFDFRASITIWPGTTTRSKRLVRAPDISNDRPAVQGWRREVQRKIRRQGYRGHWARSPWGRFGDFWKTLKDARAVRAEVERLDKLEF